jgi:hypothetical protein
MSRITLSALLTFAVAALPLTSPADTHTWTGADPGGPWWNLSGNWSPAQQPGDGDAVSISAGPGDTTIHYYNTLAPDAVLYALDLESTGGNLTFDIGNGGACDHPLAVTYETVGLQGAATIVQSAATHSVYYVSLGDGTQGTGTYMLSNGTFSADDGEYIGYLGSGTFIQTGGTNNNSARMTSSVVLGGLTGGEGMYDLSGGRLSTVNLFIGWDGSGAFHQSGGANYNAMGFFIAMNVGSTGEFVLEGTGTIESGREVQVGVGGIGVFTQNGGRLKSRRAIELGITPDGQGMFLLNGGTLIVQAGQGEARGVSRIGQEGAGTFIQNGGVFTISSTYENETLILGRGVTARGSYSLSDGTLWTNRDQYVGYSGVGTFEQSGGSNSGRTLLISFNPGSSGIYNKTGGSLSMGTIVNNGVFTNSAGTLDVSSRFTNSGTALLGGSQHWADGAVFDNTGIATFNSDAGADGRHVVVNAFGSSVLFNSSQHLKALYLGGAVNVALSRGGDKVVVTDDFSISPISKLNLNDNTLVVDYTTASPFDSIKMEIGYGRIYSALSDGTTRALGYADNAVLRLPSISGEPVDPTTVLVKYTYAGDADLNGKVDVADLGMLASNWQASGPWTSGDFDYNGRVDANDLGLLATNWQAGVGSALGPSLGEALTALGLPSISVPEPTLMAFASLGILISSLRIRRVFVASGMGRGWKRGRQRASATLSQPTLCMESGES